MRKTSKPFLILFVLLLLTMSLPLTTSEWMRGRALAILSPMWEGLSHLKGQKKQELKNLMPIDLHENSMPEIQEPSYDAVAARIIFRSLGTWNSSLWINVGEETNEVYESPLVAKNSPVLVGDSVVGVIDYMGKRQSRVRLITDSGLVPSVRVARGYEQGKAIAEYIPDLIAYIHAHEELFDNGREKMLAENVLRHLRSKLLEKKHTWYLAKGEIRGQSRPIWRTDGHLLRGAGFNYDFEDEQGPARDLRSGEPIGSSQAKAMPLIKVNDLLVTTGMDGVFPAGLKVAIVTKVDLLREGDFAFELEAKPTIGNLDDLTWVYVIAPSGFNGKDQPNSR
ncbi:Uncharacterized protein NEOC95_000813 [Neochlamydia sp. AcF95]|nr:Uncharacterized protein [Neochlamydia sp. AcF95]